MKIMKNRHLAREGLVINLRRRMSTAMSIIAVEIVAKIRQKEAKRKEMAQKLPKISNKNSISLSKSRSTGTHLMLKNMNKILRSYCRWNNYVWRSRNAKTCAELKQQITMR